MIGILIAIQPNPRKGQTMSTTIDNAPGLREFMNAYIEAMLWASTDNDGEPMDSRYDDTDLSDEAKAIIEHDCVEFLLANWERIGSEYEQAGHDFWLTRNRHGAGFWDGDWTEHGDALTKVAHGYGETDLYVGDDGKLYLS